MASVDPATYPGLPAAGAGIYRAKTRRHDDRLAVSAILLTKTERSFLDLHHSFRASA